MEPKAASVDALISRIRWLRLARRHGMALGEAERLRARLEAAKDTDRLRRVRLEIGLSHQQVQRELNDIGLHLRDALGSAPLGMLADQGGAEHVRIVRGGLVGQLVHRVPCLAGRLIRFSDVVIDG